MKKISLIVLIAILIVSTVSCSDPENNKMSIDIAYSNGVYSGFSNIPDNYSVDDAINDGCLVIETLDDGTNVHGVSLRKTGRTAGYEHWLAFLEKSQNGEDAFLRVAHFICGVGYYHDLYYSDGKYTLFDLNEYGVSDGVSYSLLRRLDGMAGPANDQKEDRFYVLTDDTTVTYNDITRRMFSSTYDPDEVIPYEWLGFMIYFDEEIPNEG